ncbi:MAG: iron-sulfur cluster-binding protein [Propionibacteriaceae bacterium]|nr:iron-sulfur cluster-binding protein [Propionibacteriaceae bacterium]
MHWARDGDEANRLVAELVRQAGADEVIKVRSMATQEMGMNEALAKERIAALETDLAAETINKAPFLPYSVATPDPSGVAVVTVESTVAAATVGRIAGDSLSRGGHPR